MAAKDGEEETPAGESSPAAAGAAGQWAGRPPRDIAADLHVREWENARRDLDGWLRTNLRQLLRGAMRQDGR